MIYVYEYNSVPTYRNRQKFWIDDDGREHVVSACVLASLCVCVYMHARMLLYFILQAFVCGSQGRFFLF